MPASRRDFFISFNSADLAYAEALDTALKDAGFTTYFHPVDLGAGGMIPAWMEGALLDSTQTLALFSPDYVKDEAPYAAAEKYASWWHDPRGRERKLIPVVIREADFKQHPIIGTLKRIECIGKSPEEAAKQIVARLKGREEQEDRKAAQLGENLPKVFHIAYRPNPNFTGRFQAMDELQANLRLGNAAVTALAGMGGIGKTTLAAEYCHHFGGRYGGVWWIRAEQETSLLSDLVELGGRLGLKPSGNIENDARTCIEHLTTLGEPWLLVYDNAPNADAVGKWLPAGKTRAIITSRNNEFGGIAKVTQLDHWSKEVTAEYLLTRTGRDDKEGAMRLAVTLDGLPLATEQAAAYLVSRKGISFNDYGKAIARLIKEPRPAGAKGDYPLTVYAAFVQSLETLQTVQGGNTALDILRLSSFLSPDGVDLDLLCVKWGEEVFPASFAAAMKDKFAREESLAALTSLSLLRREKGPFGDVFMFHRLLLEVVRDWMGNAAGEQWVTAAVHLVSRTFPLDPTTTPSSWPTCARLISHVTPLEAHAHTTGESGKGLDHLLNQAGLYLNALGDKKGALAMLERSVALKRTTRANEPLELAIGLGNLASCCADLGRLDEAEMLFREALSFEEPRLDPAAPSLAITRSNLARVYMEQLKFGEARALYQSALEIMKVAKGENSAEYSVALSNLGALYSEWADQPGESQWRVQEAEYTVKALVVTLEARGPRHPETATSYNNLAAMHTRTEDWLEAAAAMERAVAITLSLGLADHDDLPNRVAALAYLWDQSSQRDKLEHLQNSNPYNLIPIVEQIEAEHRAWVAQDPENRDFGPRSPVTGAQK